MLYSLIPETVESKISQKQPPQDLLSCGFLAVEVTPPQEQTPAVPCKPAGGSSAPVIPSACAPGAPSVAGHAAAPAPLVCLGFEANRTRSCSV